MFASATCRNCSPHIRSGGVARYPKLSSGIAAAIFITVSFNRVQSCSALS